MRWRALGRSAAAAAAAALAVPAAAGAQAAPGDPLCLGAPAPALSAPAAPLRFGITPQLAGSAGAAQQDAVPLDAAQVDARLADLHRPGRDLVVRLNRLFWSGGTDAIARYAALADHYAAAGLKVELQVRYHPPAGHDGDIDGWVAFVREATRAFAARPAVVELSITNEANLPLSANTSDGTYRDTAAAIVRGVLAARQEADAAGRPDLALGFTYASRYLPNADVAFFRRIGALATPAFRAALDHVGLQLYPGLFWPPITTDAAGDVITAATVLRHCLMPQAGLGERTRIWVTENGYPTRGGAGETRQAGDLQATVAALSRYAGTLGISDYRYFNLRDNRSRGSDLFDSVGLLFDDGRPKASFAAYGSLIDRYGAAAAPPPARPRLRVRATPTRIPRGRIVTLRVQVTREPAQAVPGARVSLGRHAARTGADGTARLRVRLTGPPGPRTVRATLRGAAPGRARIALTQSGSTAPLHRRRPGAGA